MRKSAWLMVLTALVCTGANAEKLRTLVLAGGHLPICSSMNLDACADKQRADLQRQWQQQQALFDQFYDPARLATVTASDQAVLSPAQLDAVRKRVAQLPARLLSQLELRQALAAQKDELDENTELWLYEQLEVPELTETGAPRREAFSVTGTDPDVRAVFQAFLDAARSDPTRAPRIGVLTSAGREPVAAAEFYLAWFRALGADAVWLPLDGASRALRDRGESFDRPDQACANLLAERRLQTGLSVSRQGEPQLWQQYCAGADLKPVLETLDGIFFNGGDQSLHLNALLRADGSDSPELALIRARHHAGQLAIMGTSAGTAVQTGNAAADLPMISNGSSAHAMLHPAIAATPRLPFCHLQGNCPTQWQPQQLSYRPQGGLRLFDGGILDTHFSQRGRPARLLMLLADTGNAIGLGVDETTALLARGNGDGWMLDVVGKHGVWLSAQTGTRAELVVSNHYLHRGDHARLQAGALHIALADCSGPTPPLPAVPDIASVETGTGIQQVARLLSEPQPIAVTGSSNRRWQFSAGPSFSRCPKASGAVSYRDLRIELRQPDRASGAH